VLANSIRSSEGVRRAFAAAVLFAVAFVASPAAWSQNAVNSATVTPPATVTDPNSANNSATDSDPITRTSNLSLVKIATPSPVAVGQLLTYTLTVSNAGPSAILAASTFSIVESLPAGLTGCSYTPSAGTFTVGTIASGATGTGTWTGAAIPSGGNATLTIACTVGAAAAASITNTATVVPPAGTADPDCSGAPVACAGGNTGTVTTPVTRPQLTMTKTASAASFVVGVPASYTLQVSNTGTSATTAVSTITDTIPTGLTIGTLPAGCTATGQIVTCTIAAGLAAGANTSFIIPVTATLAAANPSVNTATVSGGGDPTCPATARCTSTVSTPVNAPQLTMTKTASAASFVVGTPASYTLQVSNTGTAVTTAAATITDTIPTGLTIGTLPAGCTAAGQTVTCTIAAGLAAGASTSFVIPVTATLAAANPSVNTATVSGGGDSTCPAAARCTSTVSTPVNAPQLTMTKTASASSFIVGVPASYTLQVSNTGTAATTAVSTITDTIPTGLTIGTLPAGCTAAGQTVTCTIAAGLAAGGSTSFIIPVTATLAAANPSVNTATVSGGGDPTCPAAARCTSAVSTPVNAPQLTMTKTASAVSFVVGTPASYTLQVSNTGTAATTAAITITDTIPAGLTIGTLPAGCTAAGQTVTCTIAAGLAAGASTSFVIPVTATLAAANPSVNTATVSGGGDPTCPAAARCTSTVSTPVNAPQLTMTKTASAASFVIGTPASYTLQVSNTGTAATTAASTVTDTIPTGLTIGTLPAGCTAAGQTVTCTIAAGLAAGANTSFIIPVTATLAAANPSVNTATVSGGGDPTCPAAARCTSTVSTPVVAPQLTMTKTASAASFVVGTPASYTLQVSNTGTLATTATSTITDTIPTGLTIGTLPAGCTAAGQTVTCTIPAGLAVGANTSFIIPITPTLAAGASVTNTATVSGGGDATCPANARCTSSVTTPINAAQLTMTKTASAASFTVGTAASYTLQVSNTGTAATTAAATITDTIPAGLTIGTLPAGCTAAGQTVTCTIPAGLAAGANTSFIIPVTPTASAAASVANTATVSGGGDPTCPAAARCTSTVTTPVDRPQLTMTKTASTPSFSVGTPASYTLQVSNTGTSATTAASTITDTIPTGLTIGTLPAGCTAAGQTVTCTIPAGLAAGASTSFIIPITPTLAAGASVTNSATVSGGGDPTCPADARCTSSVTTPVNSASLNIAKTPGTATGPSTGGVYTVTYTVTVTNSGTLATTYGGLSDSPIFPSNITETGITWTTSGPGAPPSGSQAGPGAYQLAPANTPIAAGATHTFNVAITYGFTTNTPPTVCSATPTPGSGLYNVVSLPAGQENGVVTDNATCVNSPPQPPQLTMTKTASAASFTVGVPASYTLQVSNNGGVATTDAATITDTIPTGLTIGTLPAGCTAAGQTVTCTIPAGLAAGANTSFLIPVTPTLAAGTSVVNSATVSGGGDPTCPANARCTSSVTTPVNAPQLTMTKTASAASFVVGTPASYTLQVSNTGTAATTAVSTITDTIPTGLTIGTLPAGCTAAGQTVTCTIPAGLAVGANTSFIIPVTATIAAANPSVNTATVSGGGDPTCPADARCTSTVTTPINAPQLTMTKTASSATFTIGVPASYTLQVSNTGTAATTAASTITDTIPTGLTIGTLPAGCTAAGQTVTCTIAAGLAAGANTSFIIPVTPTLAAGASVTNSATVSGGGDPTCPAAARCTSTTTTPVNAPQLTMTKTASSATFTVGVAASYTLQVSNTGTAATTAASTITDTIPTGLTIGTLPAGCTAAGQTVTCTIPAGLAAGGSTSFIIPITPTEAALPDVTNTATVSGGGDPTCPAAARCTSTVTTPITFTAALTIDKTAGVPSGNTAGSTIAYSFLVTNTGNVTITGLVINDAQLDAAAVCAVTTLAPGASTTCTGTHTITQAEVNAGTVNNSATATGTTPGGGTTTSPPDTTNTPIAATPALTIDKTAGTPSGNTAGSTIAYSFLVTNTGNVTITGLVINDANLDAAAVCAVTTLAPGASTTCTGTHTITQAEVNAGVVNNSATATGTTPGGGTTTSPPDTTSTPIAATPALTIDKTAGAPSGNTAGSTIAYSFLVTNTGNVTLTGIVINDAQLDAAAVCAVTTLAPGASTTCTGIHTITQAEVNAGVVNNSATATGTTPGGGTTTSPPDTTSTPIAANPALTIDKTAGVPSGNTVGSTIAYSFLVTNTGNVTITGLVINDAQLDAAAVCAVTTLAPGASTTCTGTHTITQAEVNAGTVNNSATATGTTPGGGTTTSPPDTTNTPIAATPALTIDKTAGTPSGNTAGSTIAYSFLVTNTGNVTITGLVINDANLDAAAVCPVTTLAPGASTTCTGTHTITQAEVNAGVVSNSATATGTTPGGGTTTSPPDTTSTPIAATPALTIDKTAGTPSGNTAGSTIAYSFLVTNTGNVTLTGIVVNDAQLDAAAICAVTTLAPGASTTCTGTHTITQAEVNAGVVNNSATATGTTPGGGTTTSPPDTTSTPIAATPALTIDKTAGTPSGNTAGSTIAYTFLVSNTGNVTLTGIVINDAQLDAAAVCAVTTLAPGASTTCTGTHTITQAEVNAGVVNNSATATGTTPGGGTTTSPPDTTSTPIAATPALTIDKTAGTPSGNTAGSTIAYSFLVTNTGNVTITGLVINDAQLDAAAVCAVTTLAPGASTTCTGTHTITQAEVNAGVVNNSATATGTTPGGGTTTSPPDTTSTPITATPALTIDKTAGTPSGNTAGSTIAYSFLVTNTGNVTLTGIVVNDAQLDAAAICAVTTLAPGASTTCTGVHTITQAEVNAGTVNNSATATGTTPGGGTTTSPPDTTSTPLVAAPALTVDKTAGTPSGNAAGSTIVYSFLVTNTGNVPLTGIVVNDAQLDAPATCPVTTLAPGASTTCTGTHTITQAEVDAGVVNNSATVTGTPPGGGTTTSPPDTTSTPIARSPLIAATKTATLTTDGGIVGLADAGDVITYAVSVRNTGNVTLTGLTVVDSFEGGTPTPLTCTPTTLAPGATATCNAYTHTVTPAEAAAGGTLDNVVTATATSSTSTQTVSSTSTAVVAVNGAPAAIRIVKTASPRDVNVGDLVRYTLTLDNTSLTPMTDGTLIDTPPAGFTYVEGSLAVADADNAGRLVGTYPIRVDQLDIAAEGRATITYLLRVGAGVRAGVHTNSAYVEDDGGVVSNVATANVQMVSDPVLDDSLIVGTVWNDRDGDQWQDAAALAGVRVQGGFAADAYVPNSTTVDRGTGPTPEADASSPMLHGIDVGAITARQSEADPVAKHTVVIRQTLRELRFTDDFVLTSTQGVTVRMAADGSTRVEKSGDAAKGLNAAEPTVERRVSQVAAGYQVDYVIANAGIDERGIPGVRIASVEGLLVETDQYGRYRLVGIDGGRERGRNIILKVDPATLPPGSTFTTDNPLVRRVTPGLPIRFDFGVKMPVTVLEDGERTVEMEMGSVMFAPGSAEIRDEYATAIDRMAETAQRYGRGEVVIKADAESEALAYKRAEALRKALVERLSPEVAAATPVSLRTVVGDAKTTLVTLSETPLLGTVLFDTDSARIKPQYLPLIRQIAASLQVRGVTRVAVVGHADKRGAEDYNAALGMRRAKAVYEAIAEALPTDMRSKLRVDFNEDPAAPAGMNGQ
jgi:uncharacterized repeat protein (TIGR01451 family)